MKRWGLKEFTLAARRKMSFVSDRKREKLRNWGVKKENICVDGYNISTLPLACSINLESAFLDNDFDPSPVQSIEWHNSQSACAQDLLQIIEIFHVI